MSTKLILLVDSGKGGLRCTRVKSFAARVRRRAYEAGLNTGLKGTSGSVIVPQSSSEAHCSVARCRDQVSRAQAATFASAALGV